MLKKGNYAYVVDGLDGSKIYLDTRITSEGAKHVGAMPNDTGRDNILELSEC